MPTASGTWKRTWKAPCSSAGCDPPDHSSTVVPSAFGVEVAVQPSRSTAVAPATGDCTRMSIVGESPHPCSGSNVTVAVLPAGTATKSVSVWADAIVAGATTATRPAATAMTRCRERGSGSAVTGAGSHEDRSRFPSLALLAVDVGDRAAGHEVADPLDERHAR